MIVDIIDNIKVADAHFRMILNADSLAREVQPGQFVHLRCRDKFYYDPLLRRPFSIHRFNRDRGEVQILYKVIGKGTSWLAERGKGHKLDLLGPLGQGFNIHSNSDNAILVAGGIGVAPLLALADLIRGEYPHINLVVLLGARKREELLCERDFRDTGAEVIPVTDDGSWGRKALVTEILEDILRERKPDKKRSVIYSCGPKEMLREVSRLSMEYGLPCQISLEEMMACGVGACLGCVVAVQSSVKETFASNKTQGKKVSFKGESPKYKRVCVEGPVFSAEEVILSTTPTTRVGA